MPRLLAVLVLLVLVAGCGARTQGAERPDPESPSPTPSPEPEPEPEPVVAPLTGLPVENEAILDRPVIAIKIDNAAAARPPQGIEHADVMVTELVEGGFTRFLALFHSRDGGLVGPVRSARIIDTWVLPAFEPVFAFSGAAEPTWDVLNASELIMFADDVREQRHAAGFVRDDARPRPYNLYVPTERLWELSADLPAAEQAWTYDEAAPGGGEVTEARLRFSNRATARWSWSGHRWVRSQDGEAHVAVGGERLGADNVVIVRDPSHDAAGNVIPGEDLFGAGDATFLQDGRSVEGRWRKSGPDTHFQWFDSDGEPFDLAPGSTWIELVPEASAVQLAG